MVKRLVFAWFAFALIVGVVVYAVLGQADSATLAAQKSSHQGSLAPTVGDWTMFQNDLGRSGYNGNETTITPTSASKLKVHWTVKAGGSINTQVIEANGLLYWGSWDGYEHATDLTGNQVWSVFLGQNTSNKCVPPTVGVASTADVVSMPLDGATSVVFVAGGDDVFYALDANTGNILWQTTLGTPPAYFLWSSPVVYNGSVYEGVSSFGDCPLVRGEMVQMNANTGAIQNIFYTLPQGCNGAGVWDSPTIDAAAGTLYFGSSNAGGCSKSKPGQYYWSFIEVNASDLSLVHYWQLPPSDQHANSDFGLAAPTLFTATIAGVQHNMIGTPNQNGKYYAFDRADISMGPVWEDQLATPGRGSISSSAWDGTNLYTAGTDTTINGTLCQASARAVNPADGTYVWQDCWTAGRALNAVIAVPGVVVLGQGRYLDVLDASSGMTLFRYLDTNKHATFYGAPMISNGILYEGNQDGTLFAFGL